jgi:hypothetical protein
MWNRLRGLINQSWIGERRLESVRDVLGRATGKESIKLWIVLDGPRKILEQHLFRK